MIRLYYTITKGEDEYQFKFYNSLGGYRSATLVKNDQLDNFFGEISSYTLNKNNENQYIGLILRNEGSSKITNLKAHFEYNEDCYSDLEISAVNLIEDNEGRMFMENVPTPNSSPIYAKFYEAKGQENQVSLGDIEKGEMLGIWLKRKIKINKAIETFGNIIEVDPENESRFVQKVFKTEDVIDLVFSYDD